MTMSKYFCAFLVLLHAACVSARIQFLTVANDDRSGFLISSFGYNSGGYIELKIEEMELMVQHDFRQSEDYNISFVLQRALNNGANRANDVLTQCFHQESLAPEDFMFRLENRSKWQSLEIKQQVDVPGLYHLYFSNCEADTQVSFKLEVVEYNLDPQDHVAMFLSAGEASLPTWFMVFCVAFSVALIVWLNQLRLHRDQIKTVHYLMTLVLIFKICNLFFEALKYHSIKMTGVPHGWNIPFHIFSFLKGILMFTVVVLIGTGWSLVRPFLTERDKKIIVVVFGLQVTFNIAAVVLEEETAGAYGWLTWRDIMHLMDLICCVVILIPVVWSIRHLNEAAQVDGKAARNAEKLQRFRRFYLLVVAYIYLTRVVVFLLSSTLSFELVWLSTVVANLSSLSFYIVTGYLFRPVPHNPYLLVDGDDDLFPDSALASSSSPSSSSSSSSSLSSASARIDMPSPDDDDGTDLEAERIQMTTFKSSSSSISSALASTISSVIPPISFSNSTSSSSSSTPSLSSSTSSSETLSPTPQASETDSLVASASSSSSSEEIIEISSTSKS